jgi:ABC-type sugar transport system ATPase subunit
MTQDPILETRDISKRFPGVQALSGVGFDLRAGEVHAIVGENGAGKSTLMNILSGVQQPDAGEIRIEGRVVSFRDPLDAARHGIGIVFQELSLTYGLTVAENVFPNTQPTSLLGLIHFNRLYEETRRLLALFDEDIDPRTPVKNLSIAKQQVVEILKALARNPRILILDEPTSSLTQHEAERLFANIQELKARGIAIIYISHHIQEIFELANRATVLRDGHHVATVDVSDIDEDGIVSLMVGRKISHEYLPRGDKIDFETALLEVEGLSHPAYFRDVSFTLHPGEILTFSGLVGAGRSEVARTIFGLYRRSAGTVRIDGRPVDTASPAEAIHKGIIYTSENRKLEGLFLDMTLRENFLSTRLKDYAAGPFGMLQDEELDSYSRENIKSYGINAASIRQNVRELSGGNQQKSLLAMWLGVKPRIIIVDEPTKGVDVGAKGEIYQILRSLADAGNGIIIISSDLLEVLAISDRIVVMREGQVVGTLSNAEASEERVIALATGVAEAEETDKEHKA